MASQTLIRPAFQLGPNTIMFDSFSHWVIRNHPAMFHLAFPDIVLNFHGSMDDPPYSLLVKTTQKSV